MNFDKQYQKQEDKVERALFEPNYNVVEGGKRRHAANAEKQPNCWLQNSTWKWESPRLPKSFRLYYETNSTTKKRRKKNNIRTETDEIKRLNERLHQPESTKKQDPNTTTLLLKLGGLLQSARLIDDLIKRTEEDIRQRATIEDKEERKENTKKFVKPSISPLRTLINSCCHSQIFD